MDLVADAVMQLPNLESIRIICPDHLPGAKKLEQQIGYNLEDSVSNTAIKLECTRDFIMSLTRLPLLGIAKSGVFLPKLSIGNPLWDETGPKLNVTLCMPFTSRSMAEFVKEYPLRVKSLTLRFQTSADWEVVEM